MACDTIKDLDAALGMRIQNSSENDEVIQLAIGTGSFIYRCEPWNGAYLWLNQIKDRILPAETTAIRYVTINYCLSGRCEVRLPQRISGEFRKRCGRLKMALPAPAAASSHGSIIFWTGQ